MIIKFCFCQQTFFYKPPSTEFKLEELLLQIFVVSAMHIVLFVIFIILINNCKYKFGNLGKLFDLYMV